MKAFLSYSHVDKTFVDLVAKNLSRRYADYDSFCFSTGDEFSASILRVIENAKVFVLFLSKETIEKKWIKLEVSLAKKFVEANTIKKCLVYFVGMDVQPELIPDWLKDCLATRADDPDVTYKTILSELAEIQKSEEGLLFINRNSETERAQKIIAPIDGSLSPSMLVFSGVNGVGRKALAVQVASRSLAMRKSNIIYFEEGDTSRELALKYFVKRKKFAGKDEIVSLKNELEGMSEEQCAAKFALYAAESGKHGEATILFDETGAAVEYSGKVSPTILAIETELRVLGDTFIFLVTSFRPSENLPCVQVHALSESDTRLLVSTLFKGALEREEIDMVAKEVNGYAPSAYLAKKFLDTYGKSILLSQPRGVFQKFSGIFLKHLQQSGLTDLEKSIAVLLADLELTTVDLLEKTFSVKNSDITNALIKLMDVSVVEFSEDHYLISRLFRESIKRVWGSPHEGLLEQHFLALQSFVQYDMEFSDDIDLFRLFNRLCLRFGKLGQLSKDFSFRTDLIKALNQAYTAKDYEKAVAIGKLALEHFPLEIKVRILYAKAMIQTEKWEEAKEQIDRIRLSSEKEGSFLRGFMLRKQEKVAEALNDFRRAEKLGWSGVSIYREMANCCLWLKDYSAASMYVNQALQRESDNRFVLDLKVKINMAQKDKTAAYDTLEKLKYLDLPHRYLHSLSRVQYEFGDPEKAWVSAKTAVDSIERAPFEMLANLAKCSIKVGEFGVAEISLRRIERTHGQIRGDIVLGLKARLQIAKGDFEDAVEICHKMKNKTNGFHGEICRDAINSILQNRLLSAVEVERLTALKEQLVVKEGNEREFSIRVL